MNGSQPKLTMAKHDLVSYKKRAARPNLTFIEFGPPIAMWTPRGCEIVAGSTIAMKRARMVLQQEKKNEATGGSTINESPLENFCSTQVGIRKS